MSTQVARKPLMAAFMSLILPGYGQLYNGELNKGIILFILFALCSIPLLAFSALHVPSSMVLPVLLLSLLLTLGLWLYGVRDAYQTAKKKQDFELKQWQASSLYIASFVVAIFFILPAMTNYIRQHQVEAFRIPSDSMMPSILKGDFLFADKRYNCPQCKHTIQRGDIAVFVYPNNRTQYYIKRIIGLPGDRVSLEGKKVYVNGQALTSSVMKKNHSDLIIEETMDKTSYQTRWISSDGSIIPEFIIPQGNVFVLGDNRSASKDSREFGTVPLRDVVGKARQVWFSRGKEGIRWSRFGKVLH